MNRSFIALVLLAFTTVAILVSDAPKVRAGAPPQRSLASEEQVPQADPPTRICNTIASFCVLSPNLGGSVPAQSCGPRLAVSGRPCKPLSGDDEGTVFQCESCSQPRPSVVACGTTCPSPYRPSGSADASQCNGYAAVQCVLP